MPCIDTGAEERKYQNIRRKKWWYRWSVVINFIRSRTVCDDAQVKSLQQVRRQALIICCLFAFFLPLDCPYAIPQRQTPSKCPHSNIYRARTPRYPFNNLAIQHIPALLRVSPLAHLNPVYKPDAI